MKKLFKYFLSLAAIAACLMSCEKWTEAAAEKIDVPGKSEAYYQNLRDYKKSDHQVTFGWYGNWTGVGASLEKSMAGLPDSVDFISMWGGWKNPSKAQLKDLKFVREVKGTKALVVFLVLDIGDQITPDEYNTSLAKRKEFWGWKDGDDASIQSAIVKYANSVCDTIDKYNYDGFDMDWEPNFAHPFETNYTMKPAERIRTFIETVAKRIGPKSGTGRLFVIDGEPYAIPKDLGGHFDWFIVQAYNSSGNADLNTRLNRIVTYFDGVVPAKEVAKKLIVTENFEQFALTGGYTRFRNPDYVSAAQTPGVPQYIPSLKGMALWQPTVNGEVMKKGGVGTFHMEYEFVVPNKVGTYPFLREATHIMNPVKN